MPADTERCSEQVALLATIDPQSLSAAATLESDAIDMYLWRRALATILVGAFTSTGKLDGRLQGSVNGSTGWTNITGKAITQLTDAGSKDNHQAEIEITAAELSTLGYRYVRLQLEATTAASLVAAIVQGFSPRYHPASDFDLSTVDEIVV